LLKLAKALPVKPDEKFEQVLKEMKDRFPQGNVLLQA
jgi:hypothetical protein